MTHKTLAWWPFALVLAACNGGGGTPTQPTPTPSSSPAPSPTPTITPTPTAARFSSEYGGPQVGRIDFFPSGTVETGDAIQAFTNRSGVFVYGQADSLGGYYQPAGWNVAVRDPVYAIRAFGVDRASSLYRTAVAPLGATTVSPLTSVIYYAGSQAAVRTALEINKQGLSEENNQIIAGLDLLTYSSTVAPVQAPGTLRTIGSVIAGAMQAVNIRIAALEQAAEIFSLPPNGTGYVERSSTYYDQIIGQFIKDNPSVSLKTEQGIETFLRSLRPASAPNPYPDSVYKSAASTLNIYTRQADTILNYSYLVPVYTLGVLGQVRSRLLTMTEGGPAGTLANFSSQWVEMQSHTFENAPQFLSGLACAVPDFFRIPKGTSLTIFKDDPAFANATPTNPVRARPSLTYNDVYFDGTTVRPERNATIMSVSPSNNPAIKVTLQPDQSVLVEVSKDTGGASYFDYTAKFSNGDTATGRVYVLQNY